MTPLERPVHGVFAGGGIKGIALAGAAAGAMECGYRFEQVIGTSSGALIASLIAAGYDADDLREVVADIPWPDLADPAPGAKVPVVGRHIAFLFGMGLHRGVVLERVWRGLLRARGIRTFADLPPHALRVLTTDLTHQRGVVLPDHLPGYGTTGDRFPIARAVRMSSAVPFFFRPVPLRNIRTATTALFADGALTSNFPLALADWEARPVLGFMFRTADEPAYPLRVRGPASMVRAVVGASVRASGTVRGTLMQRATMVEIPADHDPLDFDITVQRARRLFETGRSAAHEFFDRLEEEEILSLFRAARRDRESPPASPETSGQVANLIQ